MGLYQIAFMEKGFESVVDQDAPLEGASLLLVGGDKDDLRAQPSLISNDELNQLFRGQLEEAIIGMAAEDATFEARIGTHCYDERGYGNCKILLTRAVSFVE